MAGVEAASTEFRLKLRTPYGDGFKGDPIISKVVSREDVRKKVNFVLAHFVKKKEK